MKKCRFCKAEHEEPTPLCSDCKNADPPLSDYCCPKCRVEMVALWKPGQFGCAQCWSYWKIKEVTRAQFLALTEPKRGNT